MATYTWAQYLGRWCPLHYVNSMTGSATPYGKQTDFVSTSAMARFDIIRPAESVVGCPGLWHKTSIPDVWVSMDESAANRVLKLTGSEVDPFIELNMLKAYVQHRFEMRMPAHQGDHQAACRQSLDAMPVELNFRVDEGKFGRVSGDVVIVFTCPQIHVPLREADNCYRDVPVQHPTMLFADTLTRILRADSPRVTCTAHFAPSPHPTPLAGWS